MYNNRRGKSLPLVIIYILITSLSLTALSITVWFSHTSYSSLVDFIIKTLERPDLKPLITKSLFTCDKYSLVYKIHWLLYPVIVVTSVILFFKAVAIQKICVGAWFYVRKSFFHFVQFFQQLSRTEKLILLLGCLMYIVLVLLNDHFKEISYDEAWGYNYYINKPFYIPFILFNTYPLFNIIAHVFTFLPFDTLTNIRLPSLIFGVFTLLTLFYTFYNHFRFSLAAAGLLIITASPLFYIYSTLSRGITLSLFLGAVVLHIVLRLMQGGNDHRRYMFLYVISNILGIASMPTFILFTVAASLYLIICNFREKVFLRTFIINILSILFVSSILYFPILLNSGESLIYHNSHYVFNVANTAKKLLSFLFGLSQLFFVSKYVALFLVAISLLAFFINKISPGKKTLFSFSFFIISLTFFIRATAGNIFPERSLNFLILCFLILFLLIAQTFVQPRRQKVKFLLSVTLFVACTFSYIHNQQELFSPVEDRDAKIIGHLLIKNQVKTVYIDEEEFWLRAPMIQYYYSQQLKQIVFLTSERESTRYETFDINKNYDCIVCKPADLSDYNSKYKEIYSNNNFKVLKRL